MISKIEYQGLVDCVEISNADIRVVVSTTFGPRILSYRLNGGENVLGWHPHAEVNTDLGIWKPYGGHRLWIAPEDMPRSYTPDNDSVDVNVVDDLSAIFTQRAEPFSNTQKQISIKLDEVGSGVRIDHKITNLGEDLMEISAWALTIMAAGGEAIVPNEPFAPYSHNDLLPVRTMALWPYTDLADPRWKFRKDSIGLRVDESIRSPQKFGVLNKRGWAAYRWRGLMFVKRFEFIEGSIYPDMNSNVEVYTDGGFVELETLSPLTAVSPGGSVSHVERWELSTEIEDLF